MFLEKLAVSLDIYNVSLPVYVCMTHHFHLFLTTPDGNPVSCRAARAVMEILLEDGLLEQAENFGKKLLSRFLSL